MLSRHERKEMGRASMHNRVEGAPALSQSEPCDHPQRERTSLMTSPLTEIASGLAFPEGPVMLPDGAVIVVEIARGCVTRINPKGRKTVVATPGGGPNGAALGPDGRLYVCNN